ncbi:hypothetical protein H5410_045260 [Solanum commersonii]|uniref:Uncharacterized protein n=1 Tax=Solanum commersonii TaxID=4109 RepID=A0A9J5XAK7_SOLCO|nr:hypothetical protein H5410_045260 [Solanum commersonii]
MAISGGFWLGPSVIHQSHSLFYQLYISLIYFLTQSRRRNCWCLPEKVRDAKNLWILVCYALNLIGLRVESSPKIGYKRNHLDSFEGIRKRSVNPTKNPRKPTRI